MAKIIPNEEKVFMVSMSTNTTYSGSAALKAMNEWYTMEDVTNTVKPYKVYTALLTQTGTGAPTAIVLENTTGIAVTWNRSTAFAYNTNEGFSSDPNKIAVFFTYSNNDFLKSFKCIRYSTGGDYKVGIYLDPIDNTEGMDNSTIEIRVYN
jgi:hypothetical protein